MVFKKYSFKILILILLLVSILNTICISQNTKIYVLVRLEDSTPLINATVKICLGLSTYCKTNITDNNGLTIIELSSTSNFLRTYIEYGIYGRIYYRRINYSGENIIDITIPFKKLNLEYSVTDEYLEKLSGIYELHYGDKLLITSDFDGKIVINENSYSNNTLLINTRKPFESINESIFNIEYKLYIVINNERRVYRIFYENKQNENIVIDLHKPFIKLLNTTINYIPNIQIPLYAKIYVDFNVSDGINTNSLLVKTSYCWESGEEDTKIVIISTYYEELSVYYRISFTVSLHSSFRNQLIILKIIATDLDGKSSELIEYIDVWSSISKTNITETTETFPQNTSTDQSIYNDLDQTLTSIISETEFENTSGFDISIVDSTNYIINYIYFFGLIISLIILIIEFKRYRGEYSSSY